MAARLRRRPVEQNLDSLLDTMANVTGILVVLLAVTQISMGDAMGRLREAIAQRPELSREVLEANEAEAAALQAKLQEKNLDVDALAARVARERAAAETLAAKIETLEAEIRVAEAGEPDALRAELRGAAAEAQELRGVLSGLRADNAAVERELASSASDALRRSARLPDPRPAPPGARQFSVLVRYGRVLIVDDRELVRELWRGVERALGERPASLSLSLLPLVDRIRLGQFFERVPVGASGLRWKISEDKGELAGALEWRSTTLGESIQDLGRSSSDFRRELLRTSPQRAYLNYLVWADSFEAYRSARDISDAAGFAAGWNPLTTDEAFLHSLTRAGGRGIVD